MAALDEEQLRKRLLEIFQVEAAEHLEAISAGLRELEQPAPAAAIPALIEALFREVHSLKGAARAVNLSELEATCRGVEDRLGAMKRQPPSSLPPEWFGAMYRSVNELEALLTPGVGVAPVGGERAVSTPPRAPTPAPAAAAPLARPQPAGAATADTVRIATARLAALLVVAQELLAFKFGAGHLAGELHALRAAVTDWRKASNRSAGEARALRRSRERQTLGVAGTRGASVATLLDAVAHEETMLRCIGDRLAALERFAQQERRALTTSVDALQAEIRAALMLPFSSLLEMFPKLVRDLARDSGKAVELRISGAEIEIDRRILEQMKDPLIHLVRNAIDHGIEGAAERRRAGKPAQGRITIDVAPKDGNRVELLVADDGAGIDLARVRAAAGKLGLVAPEAPPANGPEAHATLGLIFESGLTTSSILTDLSGRGLGLAIVREKVERLAGTVTVEQPAAGGTLFRVVLPTSLATFRGLRVAVGEREFVLPARSVERVLRVRADTVGTVENRDVVDVGGEVLAMVRLADALGLAGGTDGAWLPLAVVEGGGRRIAFAVDAILGEQEVLVKALGPQLRRVPNIAGAAVLGAGRLVPILSVMGLLKSALRAVPRAAAAPAAPTPARSLLVVEDSVTARTLLQSILESAGFQVETAVDGVDAFTALRTGQFDLVVSDVEMPRMDGFELTARIRDDRRLARLPVVLVTALESRADREHGVEVGADAYIVKSSFDQSNLIDVITRLL